MEELHHNVPDYSPGSHVLVNQMGVEEPSASEMEILWSTEETRSSQPRIQSNPVSDYSKEFIPIEERKWNDIPAYEHYRGHIGIQHLEIGHEVGTPS